MIERKVIQPVFVISMQRDGTRRNNGNHEQRQRHKEKTAKKVYFYIPEGSSFCKCV